MGHTFTWMCACVCARARVCEKIQFPAKNCQASVAGNLIEWSGLVWHMWDRSFLVLVAVAHIGLCCACPGINPRVKSGRFMKLLPDYEHMDYRDVYTHCMYISLLVEHEELCVWVRLSLSYNSGHEPCVKRRVEKKISAAWFLFVLTIKRENCIHLYFYFLLMDRSKLTSCRS